MNFRKNIVISPENYAKASVLAKEVGKEMLARLDLVTLKPKKIVDAGCGTGAMSALLKARYPDAEILAVDHDEAMIAYAKEQCKLPIAWLHADLCALPIPDQSVDLIYANFLLPMVEDLESLLASFRRILHPDGLLILTTLGPDTLHAWRENLDENAMPYLIDLHNLGDVLQTQGFVDPVVDVDYFTLVYSSPQAAMRELIQSLMYRSDPPETFSSIPLTPEGWWPLTYEVVYAQAFAPMESAGFSASDDGIVRVPISHLRRTVAK